MKRTKQERYSNKAISLSKYCILSCISLFFASSAIAEDLSDRIGYAEFRLHCAVCHGRSGAGAGSIAGLLNVTADQLDLTRISQRNNGKYPFRNIFEVIDGRQNVAAHGERLMPVWGDRYSFASGDKYGPYGSEEIIRGRILELVYFINGIQKE